MKMNRLYVFVAALALIALLGCQSQAPQASLVPASAEPDYWPTREWKTSTPEQQGMDSGRLAAMFDAIEQKSLDLHSVVVIRNGYVVTEAYFAPHNPAVRQQVMSVTKSVGSMLAGIVVGQGRIQSTSQPLLAFFPGRTVANLDQNKRSLTLEHLLTMTTGLDCSDDTGALDRMLASPDWVQFALDLPVAAAPGAQFRYCSPAAHLLSGVLSQATGKSERELANEVLFAPLGIPPAGSGDWLTDPQGAPHGYDGLSLTPRDMARLGFLYLHGGRWNGQQVVPATWVAASLSPHTTDATGRGYGYLWWLYKDRGYFSAMGLGGQDIHIIPAKNMVVVFTASMDSQTHDREVIKLLDDYIVPAAVSDHTLPENAPALSRLQALQARPSVPQPVPPLPALARSVSGKVYNMDPNPNGWAKVSLRFEEGSSEAVATTNGSDRIVIGLDNVYRTTGPGGDGGTALRGRWEDGGVFVVDQQDPGDFRQWKLRLTFPGDEFVSEARDQVTGAALTMHGHLAP